MAVSGRADEIPFTEIKHLSSDQVLCEQYYPCGVTAASCFYGARDGIEQTILAAGGNDSQLYVHMMLPKVTREGHTINFEGEIIEQVQLSPNGEYLFVRTSGETHTIQVYETNTLFDWEHDPSPIFSHLHRVQPVIFARFTKDSTRLEMLTGGEGTPILMDTDLRRKDTVVTLRNSFSESRDICYMADMTKDRDVVIFTDDYGFSYVYRLVDGSYQLTFDRIRLGGVGRAKNSVRLFQAHPDVVQIMQEGEMEMAGIFDYTFLDTPVDSCGVAYFTTLDMQNNIADTSVPTVPDYTDESIRDAWFTPDGAIVLGYADGKILVQSNPAYGEQRNLLERDIPITDLNIDDTSFTRTDGKLVITTQGGYLQVIDISHARQGNIFLRGWSNSPLN
jgi:hypothetical protein